MVAAGLVTVGGGIGGTILYAKWDEKFRAAIENNVPYSDWLLGLALGPIAQDGSLPVKKQVRIYAVLGQDGFTSVFCNIVGVFSSSFVE